MATMVSLLLHTCHLVQAGGDGQSGKCSLQLTMIASCWSHSVSSSVAVARTGILYLLSSGYSTRLTGHVALHAGPIIVWDWANNLNDAIAIGNGSKTRVLHQMTRWLVTTYGVLSRQLMVKLLSGITYSTSIVNHGHNRPMNCLALVVCADAVC